MSKNTGVELYGFEPRFERFCASLCCASKQFWGRVGWGLEPDAMMEAPAKLAVKACGEVARELGHGPGDPVVVMQRLHRWMSDGKVTLDEVRAASDMLAEAAPTDPEKYVNELAEVLRRRMRMGAVRAAMDEYTKRGDFTKVAEQLHAADRLGKADAAGPITSTVKLSDVQPEKVSWLWRGRIPLGKVTILDGDPGLGKSTLLLDIAARVTIGQPMPGEVNKGEPRDVVLISYEDGLADTIRPRLEAAGGDPSKVHVIKGVPCGDGTTRLPTLPDDIPAIEAKVREKKAALLIVDPLMAALSGRVDSAKDHNIRRALAPLAAMAEKLGAAVVAVRHLNKGGVTSGPTALYRGGGSIGINGAARSVLLVGKDPDDPNARILASVKMNLACAPASLKFTLVPAAINPEVARVDWQGESERTADELVQQQMMESREERSKVEEAKEFLRDILGGGPRLATHVLAEAKEAGIATPTLRRAKYDLGVVVKKSKLENHPWTWELPAAPPPPVGDDHLDHLDHLRPDREPAGDLGGNGEGDQPGGDDHLDHLPDPHPAGDPGANSEGDQGDQGGQGDLEAEAVAQRPVAP